ncbi:FbpB family small basic protein [Ectobacillus funiculus]
MKREVDGAMKKVKVSLSELIRKNKEELLKDKNQLERIEKRIDEKYVNAK